jgi:hypothetical protein
MRHALDSLKHGMMVQLNNADCGKAGDIRHKLRQGRDQRFSQFGVAARLPLGYLDTQHQKRIGKGKNSLAERLSPGFVHKTHSNPARRQVRRVGMNRP